LSNLANKKPDRSRYDSRASLSLKGGLISGQVALSGHQINPATDCVFLAETAVAAPIFELGLE
jgi:hypothetical protein